MPYAAPSIVTVAVKHSIAFAIRGRGRGGGGGKGGRGEGRWHGTAVNGARLHTLL